MRDMRDAKAMAQTLRRDLAAKTFTISNSESLELVSHMFGLADWNTLSALQRTRQTKPARGQERIESAVYPAIPMRDLAPLPVAQLPLYLKRDKTLRALDAAFAVQRQVVLVMQKSPDVDDPGEQDVHAGGALARVLDIGPPSEQALSVRPDVAGTTEVLVQLHRRVKLLSFSGSDGAYSAEVEEVDEGRIQSAPELIRTATACFETYAAAHAIELPSWLERQRYGDPGRLADLLALRAPIPLARKQELLETFDPVARLERLVAIIQDG